MTNNFKNYLFFWLIPLLFLGFWHFKQLIFTVLAGVVFGSVIQTFAYYLTYRLKLNYYINIFLIYLLLLFLFGAVFYFTLKIFVEELPDLRIKLSPYFDIIENFIPQNWQDIFIKGSDYLPNVGNFLFNLFGGLLFFISALVISVYVSLNKNFPENLMDLFLINENKDLYLKIWRRIKRKISFWFLGQIFLVLFVGVAVYFYVGLILKIKYSALISVLAGVLEMVPILGPTISLIVTSIIVFIDSPNYLLPVIIFFILLQQLESYFIVPLVMKKATALDPLLIILGIFIGGKIGGIFGIITIIPILVSLIEVKKYLKMRDGVIGSTQDSGS